MAQIHTRDKKQLATKMSKSGQTVEVGRAERDVLTERESWTSFSCSVLSGCQRGKAELHQRLSFLFVQIPADPFSMVSLPLYLYPLGAQSRGFQAAVISLRPKPGPQNLGISLLKITAVVPLHGFGFSFSFSCYVHAVCGA